MSIRGDITVNWALSPRIITVESPAVSVTIQDIVDTCRSLESELANVSYPSLVSAAGKDALGGGVLVGLTATLLNAKISFEARTTPKSTGISTSAGSATVLTNTSATFITDGVTPGATVMNYADKSVSTIISVDSQTQLTHFTLQNGVSNQWGIGDAYKVFNEVQCNITGGNLVAVDSSSVDMDPVYPTAFVQIVKTSSSSATIAELEITNLQRIIEGLRSHHKGFGKLLFWDPSNGNDANSGISPTNAVLTFSKAHDLATDWGQDIITLVPKSGSSTMISESLVITKNFLFIRGMGFNAHLHPTSTTPSGNLIDISGKGVEISGFHIEGVNITTPNTNGIKVTNSHVLIKDCTVEECTGHGIVVTSSVSDDRSIIENCFIRQNGKSGLQANTVNHLMVYDTEFEMNIEHGVDLVGVGVVEDVTFKNCSFLRNSGYGLKIGNANVEGTTVESNCTFDKNTLGKYLDNGTASVFQSIQEDLAIAGAVWDEPKAGHVTAGTFGAVNQIDGLTAAQATMLTELYAIMGLDPTKPLVVAQTTRQAGTGIHQSIDTTTVPSQTTVTRV